jgi:hypothetical protein
MFLFGMMLEDGIVTCLWFEVWQQGLDLYPESYMETYPGANLVANDEIIAHTLQEEFESLAADETSEAASPIVPVFENLQVECQPAV